MSNTRSFLSQKDRIKLADFMRETYVASKMSDDEFAVAAAKEIGSPVNRNHVISMRRALEIQNNNPRPPAKLPPDTLEGQIAALQARIDEMSSGFEYRLRLLEQK